MSTPSKEDELKLKIKGLQDSLNIATSNCIFIQKAVEDNSKLIAEAQAQNEKLTKSEASLSDQTEKLRLKDDELQRVLQQLNTLKAEVSTLRDYNTKLQKQVSDYQSRTSKLEQELVDAKAQSLAATQVAQAVPQPAVVQPAKVENSAPPVSNLSPPVSAPILQPARPGVKVPIFCAKNVADLPNVIEILNDAGASSTPQVWFQLQSYDATPIGETLAIVLALCGTDRVDIVDKDILTDLRDKKRCTDVLMIKLRRGNDPSKFSQDHDTSINSGVKNERVLFQLVHFKGKVLMEADVNKKTVAKFLEFVKLSLAH